MRRSSPSRAYSERVERPGAREKRRDLNAIVCLDYALLLALIIPRCSTGSWGIRRAEIGGSMAFDAAIADGLLSRRSMGWPKTIALALAAVAVALGAAAWI